MARTKQSVAAKWEEKQSVARGAEPPPPVGGSKVIDGEAVGAKPSDEDEDEDKEEEGEEEEEYTVESIVKERKVGGKPQYLVAWAGFAEQTWEPLENVEDTVQLELWHAAKEKFSPEYHSEEEEQTRSGRGKKRAAGSSGDPRYKESKDDDASYEEDEESDDSASESSEGYVPEGRGGGGRHASKRPKAARPLSERQLAAFTDGLAVCEPEQMRAALEAVLVKRPELHGMLRSLLELDD